MRKFVRTYSPFLVYFVCVALAYFLCFYLFPKYNAALAYFGFLIIYTLSLIHISEPTRH